MIRLIHREFVRVRSYAFPSDSPLPQLSKSLPRRLRRKKPSLEVDADDLVTLHFYLRSRVACVQTGDGVVAWNVAAAAQLRIHFRQGAPQTHPDVQPAEQAAQVISWDVAPPSESGFLDTQDSPSRAAQEEHSLSQGIMAPPVIEGEPDATPVAGNGDFAHLHFPNGGSGAISELGPMAADGNGAEEHTGLSYIRLELLEPDSERPHVILSSNTYSLALLARYRLLAETLAGWAGATTSVESS